MYSQGICYQYPEDKKIEEHCRGCKYWVKDTSTAFKHCDYLFQTGHSRAKGQQNPLDCKGYGRRKRGKSD